MSSPNEIPQGYDNRNIGYACIGAVGGSFLIVAAVCNRLTLFSPRSVRVAQVFTVLMILAFVAVAAYSGYRDFDAGGKPDDAVFRGFGEASSFLLSIMLFPTMKHTGLGLVLGSSYERMLWMHPVLGTLFAVTMLVHAVGVNAEGPKLTSPSSDAAMGPYVGFCAIPVVLPGLFAQRLSYRFFRYTHLFYALIYLFATLHYSGARRSVLPGVILFVVDVLIRIWTTFMNASNVESCCVFGDRTGERFVDLRVRIRRRRGGASPPPLGSYYFLRIAALSLIPHPFSLAKFEKNAEEEKGDTLRFLIKVHDDDDSPALPRWISRLRAGPAWSTRLAGEAEHITRASVHATGPYGNLQVPVERVERLVLVAGGVGITPMLHILNEAVSSGLATSVVLVWVCRSPALMSYVLSSASGLLPPLGGTFRQASVFCTAPGTETPEPSGFSIAPDRPNFFQLFSEVMTTGQRTGCYICGPAGLMNAARDAAVATGMAVHQEIFEFSPDVLSILGCL